MGVLSVIKEYGTEILNAVRDNDLKAFRSICDKQLKHDKLIAQLCIMDIKHRPSRRFACPLIIAARLEEPTIIRYMMEIGTNPNFIHHSLQPTGQKDLVTPLHVAADLNLIRTADVLLNFSADPNIADHNEDTPFIISIKHSNWMLMKMMLSKGGSISITDKKGNAPLHIATLHGHLQIVKTLLKNNADIHQRGHQGAIPSHIAAREGHIHLVQIFCAADPALVNTKIPCFTDKREKAMLHLAAERGHAETVIALIDQFGADLNVKDSTGNTPLHCVVLHYYQHVKMRDKDYFYATAKILIKCKSLIDAKNNSGQTALHLAAMNNHPKIVELLLSVGSNAFAEDNNRMKPIDVVPEEDTVSKQLLKTAMLHPKPPINVSSLSLANNSSFFIHTMGDANESKNRFISKLMMESIESSPTIKSRNMSLDSSIFASHIKNCQSPTNHRAKRSLKTKESMFNFSKPHRKLSHKRSIRSQSSENNSSSVYSSRSHNLNSYDYRYYSDGSSKSSSNDTLNEKKLRRLRRRDYSSYKGRTGGNDRSSKKIHQEVERISKTDRSYATERNSRKISEYRDKSKHTKRRSEHKKVSQGYASEGHSIEVHRIPGKPKTIEVEYMNGPITIEFENQEQDFQGHTRIKEGSHRDSPEVKRQEADGILSDWFNEMMKYNKNKNKNSMDEDAWDEYEESITNKRGRSSSAELPEFNKLTTGQVRKDKMKKIRQMQFEEQNEMEKLPIADPEPPLEKLEVVDNNHFLDDSSFNSESFEEEINDTQKVLNDSASKKIVDVLQSIKLKWSQDENNDEMLNNLKPIKNKLSHANKVEQTPLNTINVKHIKRLPSEDVQGIYQSNFRETINMDTVKLEVIPFKNENLEKRKRDGISSNAPLADIKNKNTYFKISGETPKAYTRKGKASARAKFILATPAKIESSSEASDCEQSSPITSLQRRSQWSKPLSPLYQDTTCRSTSPNVSPFKTECNDFRSSITHLNPYKSFGKIETKTDALEDTLRKMEGKSLETEASSVINYSSLSLSTIIPEKYQIKIPGSDDSSKKIIDIEEIDKAKPSSKKAEDESAKVHNQESCEILLQNYKKEPNSRMIKPQMKKNVGQQMEKKMKPKTRSRPNISHEPSPKASEEACSPSSSPNGYTFYKRKRKTHTQQLDEINFERYDEFSSHSHLDMSVPLASGDSEQSSINSLNMDVPISSDNEKEATQKLISTSTNSERFFYLKKGSFDKKRSPGSNNEKKRENQPRPFHHGKLKKPPKPLNSELVPCNLEILDDKMKEARQNVEDLNELPLKNRSKTKPKYPSRPYDVHRMISSDSEMNTCSPTRKHFYYIHSEAEASDFEQPKDPLPGTTYKEAALQSLNSKIRSKSLFLRQPGHHDKSFEYLRKLYLPRRKKLRVRSMHLLSSAGKYGDRELRRVMSNHCFTESESEIDQNKSFITDDELEDRTGSSQSLLSKHEKKFSPIYESLMRYKKFKMRSDFKAKEEYSIGPPEPQFGYFENYDDVARMWIEQVDKKTVLKSNNMYLKVLTQSQNIEKYADNINPSSESFDVLPHWVVAKTRFIQTKMNDPTLYKMSLKEEMTIRKHLILFFKIGMNWMELAWVLFDGLSTESEIVRMIKDIQIKHPSSLNEQVEDLMGRWWLKKGDLATIQELKRALDILKMFYIQKEIDGDGDDIGILMKKVEAKDTLEIEKITEDDQNISNLCQEYDDTSQNSSIIGQSWNCSNHSDLLTLDHVMRKLQTSKTILSGMNEDLTKASRASSKNQEYGNHYSKSHQNLFEKDKKKKKQPMRETNL